MNPAAAVIIAVANELAQRAKAAMPKLREGECVRHEWLDGSVYYRETVLDGETYLTQYDFKDCEAPQEVEAAAPKKQNKKKATA